MNMRKLPQKSRTYAPDTNLLSWLFMIARSDLLLTRALNIIQFIREHPQLSEDEVRKHLELEAFKNMPPKRTRSP